MPSQNKKTVVSKRVQKKMSVKKQEGTDKFKSPGIMQRLKNVRKSGVHKSFVLTRRRDVPKHTPLPGYISFSFSVLRVISKYRRHFFVLLSIYLLTSLLLIGVSQQDQFRSLSDSFATIDDQTSDAAPVDAATQIIGLFGSTFAGSLNGSLTDVQQFYMALLYLIMWLVVIWMLRQLLNGNVIKVRDALYNACAPLISTICIVGLLLAQMIPGILGVAIFSIATQDGMLSNGATAMVFGVMALLLLVLSLYWISSSIFALLMVTLPGMYPMKAVKAAGEIALGRRTSLMLRLVWLGLLLAILWVVILLPALLIDYWVKVSWFPIVVISLQLATGLSLVVGVTYIYMLYRTMLGEKNE